MAENAAGPTTKVIVCRQVVQYGEVRLPGDGPLDRVQVNAWLAQHRERINWDRIQGVTTEWGDPELVGPPEG